jgi:phosphoglycolate phosphatase-like HAD superfamily hydrolase
VLRAGEKVVPCHKILIGELTNRAAIFDGDGTLVDSVDLHAEFWHKAFLHFAYDIPTDVETHTDASAAAKAGIRCIGLLCGGFPKEDLPAAGCIAIFRNPADRLANYERSPLTAHRAVPEEPAA